MINWAVFIWFNLYWEVILSSILIVASMISVYRLIGKDCFDNNQKLDPQEIVRVIFAFIIISLGGGLALALLYTYFT